MCDICVLVYIKLNYNVKFAKLIVPICLIDLPPVSSFENAVGAVNCQFSLRDEWAQQNHSGQLVVTLILSLTDSYKAFIVI